MIRAIKFAIVMLLGVALVTPAFAQGTAAADYAAKCKMCHGADGTGNAAMKVASFKAPECKAKTDAQLVAVTTDGKPPKMPAYKGKLTDAQISDLVKYIRTLQK